MSKKKKINKDKEKTVRSINNNIRSSVRKLNPILKGIVGKKVDVAIRDLEFTRKRIAHDVKKTVQSAIANAENNYQYDIDNLYVKEAYVGKSLVMKNSIKYLLTGQMSLRVKAQPLTLHPAHGTTGHPHASTHTHDD